MAEHPPDRAPAQPDPDVRFSLANERTLLAYQRTAVGLMAAAIAVVHFFGDGLLVLLLGLAFLGTAAIAAVGGYRQYVRVDAAIRAGRTVSGGPAAHVLSVALVVCLLVAAVYVLTRSAG